MPTDIVFPFKRSQMMSGIRGKSKKPALAIRSALHRMDFLFRLHGKDLSSRLGLVFPRPNAILFVHGCFWHGQNFNLFRWPKFLRDFRRHKINSNIERDHRQHTEITGRLANCDPVGVRIDKPNTGPLLRGFGCQRRMAGFKPE